MEWITAATILFFGCWFLRERASFLPVLGSWATAGTLYLILHPGQPPGALLQVLLCLLGLCQAAWTDAKTRTVPPNSLLCLLAAGLARATPVRSLIWAGGVLLLIAVLLFCDKMPLPGGDLKFICVCFFYWAGPAAVAAILAGCVLVLLHMAALAVLRRPVPKAVPFIPYLALGWYLCLLWY